jgi:hypothetical protein
MAGKAQDNGDVTVQTGSVTTPNAFGKLLIKMAGMATLDEAEGRITGDDIIPILEAETEEEMWDADELPRYNAKMLSGCELEVHSFDVKYGTGTNEEIKTPFVTSDGRQSGREEGNTSPRTRNRIHLEHLGA